MIKTPPASPQFPVLASSLSSGRDSAAFDLEQHTRGKSSTEFLRNYKAKFGWVSSLMDIIPLSGACPGVEVLSAQLLRENCPINELLIMLNDYRKLKQDGLDYFLDWQRH
jgi:uncharacterized protein (DUF1919 family)